MILSVTYCEDKDVHAFVKEALEGGTDIMLSLTCRYLYTDEESPTYLLDHLIWSKGDGEIFDCQLFSHIKRIVQKIRDIGIDKKLKEYRQEIKKHIKEVDKVSSDEMSDLARRWRNGEDVGLTILDALF